MSEIPIQSYPVPMRPIVVIERRIALQMERGGLLEGVKEYDREGRVDVLGAKDLPIIQPLQYIHEEEIWAGAPKGGQSRGNTTLRTRGTLELFVGCKVDYGFFRRDDTDDKGTGIMEWIDRIKDSIELRDVAQPDAIVVEGAAKSNGLYLRNGDNYSKPKFNLYGGNPLDAIHYDGSWWLILEEVGDGDMSAVTYYSEEDVATPDLASSWVKGAFGQLPVPRAVRRATWADIDSAEVDRDSVPLLEGTGVADSLLDETLTEPVRFTLGENYISNLTLALILEVRFATVGYYRGYRSP